MKNKSPFVGNNQYSKLSVYNRFWQKVDKKDDAVCWNWIGSVHHIWKYGHFSVDGRLMEAHRYSWILHNGEIPIGMLVCHHCDNPSCVNPAHLFLGTNQDNMDDKIKKNRQARVIGENNPKAKLTEMDVKEIRRLHKTGIKGATLGRIYKVTNSNIYDILSGKRWSHIMENKT